MEHLITAVVALAVGVLIGELYIWLPALRRWLVKSSARLAPKSCRSRLEEEWLAVLEAMPNSLAMLGTTIGFAFAAVRMRHAAISNAALIYVSGNLVCPWLTWQSKLVLGQILIVKYCAQRDRAYLRAICDDLDPEDEDIIEDIREIETRISSTMEGVQLAGMLAAKTVQLSRATRTAKVPFSNTRDIAFVSYVLSSAYVFVCRVRARLTLVEIKQRARRLFPYRNKYRR